MSINEDECREAGMAVAKVKKVGDMLDALVKEAGKLNVEIFGGSSCLSLRRNLMDGNGPLVLYESKIGNISGGDGSTSVDEKGLTRGEYE